MDFFPGDKVKFIVDDGLYIVTSTYDDGDCDIYSPKHGWGLTVKGGQLKLADQDVAAYREVDRPSQLAAMIFAGGWDD